MEKFRREPNPLVLLGGGGRGSSRHHTKKVRIRLDRLLDGRAGFEVALLAKGIDLADGNPDLNDLLIEAPSGERPQTRRPCPRPSVETRYQ